jgi:hypothetical protein
MNDAGIYRACQTCRHRDSNVMPVSCVSNNLLTVHYQEPLSRIPSMRPADLQRALKHFSTWLSGLEVLHSPRLSRLVAQKLHERIHQDALRRVVKDYRMLCEEIGKAENKYEAASTLLGSERPFGRVDLLYQIFGLEEEENGGDDDDETSEEHDSEESEEDSEEQ